MGQWVIVLDFGVSYHIYQACELVTTAIDLMVEFSAWIHFHFLYLVERRPASESEILEIWKSRSSDPDVRSQFDTALHFLLMFWTTLCKVLQEYSMYHCSLDLEQRVPQYFNAALHFLHFLLMRDAICSGQHYARYCREIKNIQQFSGFRTKSTTVFQCGDLHCLGWV